MTEWQDISSAPKDGTELLLYCPEFDAPYWMSLPEHNSCDYPAHTGRMVGRFYGGEWVSYAGESSYEDSVVAIGLRPTHWQPLPAAPQNTTGETK